MEKSAKSSGRIPPQNIEAEKSLLGAILISDNAIMEAASRIKSDDFYDDRHKLIYVAMINLYEKRRPIDLLTLVSELRSSKNLDRAGGSSYITELTNFVPTATNASAYADLVESAATRRRLITAATAIAEKAFDDNEESITTVLDEAQKVLFSASDKNNTSNLVAVSSIIDETVTRIEDLYENKGKLRGLKTGFADLDHKTAGLQKGDLVIIGARPAMGKTTFAINLAHLVASINKKPVLFFSLEMPRSQIVDRILSDLSGVDSWKIRKGDLSEEDLAKIYEALDELSTIPLYIDDTSNTSITELRAKARRAKHDHDIGMVIIDYLQIMSGSTAVRNTGNRVQEVSEISRGLKILARELDVPVIALAQLSRSVTGRDDPRPVLSDLRESGSIEQDADIVTFLHRPDYYKKNNPDYIETHISELLIEKHRNGPTGKIELYFDADHLRFRTLDKTYSEE